MTSKTTDKRYAIFDFYDVGAREHMEDRSRVAEMVSADGRKLHVAIVCDGVGGVDKGEVAAQVAIDTALAYLQRGAAQDMPTLLEEASLAANHRVMQVADEGKCTFALAVIVDDGSRWGRLYIASAGDSPIVLAREGKLSRLNREHNVAAESVFLKGTPLEIAYKAPNAHALTRALGVREGVKADIGFYTNAPDEMTGLNRGRAGLELKEGDTIYVMSDGMIDTSPIDFKPCVREEELIRHALDRDPEAVARILVAFAKGRKTQDNASLAVILVAPDSKLRRNTINSGVNKKIIAALAAVAVIAAALFFLFVNTSDELDQTSVALAEEAQRREQAEATGTQVAQAALDATLTATSWTATPTLTPTFTPTLLPVVQPGEVGVFNGRGIQVNYKPNDVITASSNGLLTVYLDARTNLDEYANIYMAQNAALRVNSVDSNARSALMLSDTGQFLIQTGAINGGIRLQLARTTIEFSVAGSCMGVTHQADQISMTCYAGNCSVKTEVGGNDVPVPVGSRVTIANGIASPTSFSSREADAFANLIFSVAGTYNNEDYRTCNLRQYVSTPVPTATTLVIATAATTNTATAAPVNLPTQQQQATTKPSNTPIPTATHTPLPPDPTEDPQPPPDPTEDPQPPPDPTEDPQPPPDPTEDPQPPPDPTEDPQPPSEPEQ